MKLKAGQMCYLNGLFGLFPDCVLSKRVGYFSKACGHDAKIAHLPEFLKIVNDRSICLVLVKEGKYRDF